MKKMVFISVACWAAAFVVWALGWTNALSVLSLTAPPGEYFEVALIKAAIVLCTWFGAVMIAPVLMLTAVTWKLVSLKLPTSPRTQATRLPAR
jgi:hypothetical protein